MKYLKCFLERRLIKRDVYAHLSTKLHIYHNNNVFNYIISSDVLFKAQARPRFGRRAIGILKRFSVYLKSFMRVLNNFCHYFNFLGVFIAFISKVL